jgi:hypothetical protein
MSAIGFAMTLEAFQEQVEQIAPQAVRFETPIGAYLCWSTGEGIELWLQANAVNKVVGCNPHFAGQGRIDAAIIETVSEPGRPLDGRCLGWAAPRDPANPYSGLHPLAASLPNFAFVDERILMPPVVSLQVAAFASHLECYPTEGSFLESEWAQLHESRQGAPVWHQVEVDGRPSSEAAVSGTVVASERCRNPVTGQEFHALVLQVDGGTIDVVADLETAPRRPVVGMVAAGTFWLSARAVGELPEGRAPLPFQRARAHT